MTGQPTIRRWEKGTRVRQRAPQRTELTWDPVVKTILANLPIQDALALSHGVTIADVSQLERPLIYCNTAFTDLTGYTSAEVLGQSCRFLQGTDTDPDALQQLRDALHSGKDCQVVLKNYRKDGVPFWNELTLSPVYSTGILTHFVGIQHDVTAHHEMRMRGVNKAGQAGGRLEPVK